MAGIDAVHASTLGLSEALDPTILERARSEGWVLVTLDADFHAILALSGARRPSVIRVRVEGLNGAQLVAFLKPVIERCRESLEEGTAMTVTASRIRLRRLPIVPWK